jgi:hypothetical protein
LPLAKGSQFAVEEFGGGAIGADPIAPAEQVVNFVGGENGVASKDLTFERLPNLFLTDRLRLWAG